MMDRNRLLRIMPFEWEGPVAHCNDCGAFDRALLQLQFMKSFRISVCASCLRHYLNVLYKRGRRGQ